MFLFIQILINISIEIKKNLNKIAIKDPTEVFCEFI